jgi:hypothetical protein
MTVERVRTLWKKLIPVAAAVAVLGAGATAVAQRYLGDCCYEGAPCCKPGAACCNGKHAKHAATPVAEN